MFYRSAGDGLEDVLLLTSWTADDVPRLKGISKASMTLSYNAAFARAARAAETGQRQQCPKRDIPEFTVGPLSGLVSKLTPSLSKCVVHDAICIADRPTNASGRPPLYGGVYNPSRQT